MHWLWLATGLLLVIALIMGVKEMLASRARARMREKAAEAESDAAWRDGKE
jgi:hypothetical protein